VTWSRGQTSASYRRRRAETQRRRRRRVVVVAFDVAGVVDVVEQRQVLGRRARGPDAQRWKLAAMLQSFFLRH